MEILPTQESIGGQGAPGFSASECVAVDDRLMDCTEAMERRFGAPALHQIVVPAPGAGSFFCRALRLTTVTKRAAVVASTGIGFYYRGYGGEGRFIPTAKLKGIGDAIRAADGAPVDLHEFVGLANCWLGTASSSAAARYEFKPYVAFESGGETYRNWDFVGNHAVSLSHFVWDRSAALLR